jgi:alpha-tubulin suppressor-like RCC1 family protein
LWAFGGFPNGAYNSPIQSAIGDDWKQASSSDYFGNHYVVKDDGTLWDWGCDGSLAILGSCLGGPNSIPTQLFSDMGSDWKQVSSSGFTTAAIKNDGTLWTWGDNFYGQLGDDSLESRSSPVQTAAGGSNWAQVSCSKWNIAAVKTDGTLWIWGSNYAGVLANGETSPDKSSPVQTICGGNNWAQVSIGQCNGAAVKTDGTLWTWGFNSGGQLGIGTSSYDFYTSPVQTSLGGTDWKSASVGGGSALGNGLVAMAAVKTDGTLWLWGNNFYAALGDGTTNDKSEPTQEITSSISWAQVITSWTHTGAIKTDGSLWLWGDNGYGELGDETSASKSSPVQTIMGGSTWFQIALAENHTIAIKD